MPPTGALASAAPEAGPQGFRGRCAERSARGRQRLPPELDCERERLRVAVDVELHGVAGLLRGDHGAQAVGRVDGDAVDLDDQVAAERPALTGDDDIARP